MSYEPEDDEDDEAYFSELDETEDTGKGPKFVLVPQMSLSSVQLGEMRVDALVEAYRAIRDQLGTDRKAYKSREAKLKTQLHIISMSLLNKGDEMGVDNFNTAHGTAYRHKKESFRVENWEAFVAYLVASGNFQAVQKRVSPNAVKEIREQDGGLPPGVSSFTEIEFSVRSPTARKK